MLLQKHRDRKGRCIAILFKRIAVRGPFDSPEWWFCQSWFSDRGWGQQHFTFQSPAVHWMARTSSLNCLSCRNPYQTPIHWIASPLFTENPIFFTKSASSHPLPKIGSDSDSMVNANKSSCYWHDWPSGTPLPHKNPSANDSEATSHTRTRLELLTLDGQEPLNAPFLNGLFSRGLSRGKTAQ